jgi:DNA-binding transcriptional MerR regulator
MPIEGSPPSQSIEVKKNHNLLSIREMCELFGVTPRTLRFYESKELLFPQRHGLQRCFTYSDQVRTKLILRGKRFGFSLEEIRRLLELYDKNDPQETQLKETYLLAMKHLEEMQSRRLELDDAITDLKQEMASAADRLENKLPCSARHQDQTQIHDSDRLATPREVISHKIQKQL